MLKITELKETRYRTIHKKDANGNRYTEKENYIISKEVKGVTSLQRYIHFQVDVILISLLLTFVPGVGIEEFIYQQESEALYEIYSLFLSFTYTFAYYFFFEFFLQKTPPKFLTKSVVIDAYGNKPALRTMLVRTIIRIIPIEWFSFIINKRGWHDKWSDTWVVHESELAELKRLQAEQSQGQIA